MGRPKKSEADTVPTGERLLRKAVELFAEKGLEAVSVRDITRSLGLNEATLYIHYENKSALLDAILERLEKRLIGPGFAPAPAGTIPEEGSFDPAGFLIAGAKRFFSRADKETLLTWRILMNGQYSYESARRSVEDHLLNAPIRFFSGLLEAMKEAGRIGRDTDCGCAGRIISAVFFEYSFRSNLKAAWDESDTEELRRLEETLRFFMRRMVE